MNRFLPLAASTLLSAVFAAAAAIKLVTLEAFAGTIERFHLAPHPLTPFVAAYIPWLELVLAVALWMPRYRRDACLLLLIVLAVFSVFLAWLWSQGETSGCGCFGPWEGPWSHPLVGLLRNTFLAVVAGWLHQNSDITGPSPE